MISRSEAEWYAFLILALVAMFRIDRKFDKVMISWKSESPRCQPKAFDNVSLSIRAY
jgi:hypothetical protein